ncbi:cystatin-A-like [Erpetoichthys calabaricus]|uniref:cystatin-A-like n=1 Tax=Erpetoichthys calabaricus TaxID=27687 RepID=UPI002233E353|nr:cystatin-A-like [Erpetoichthys calabaricus]
MAEVPGGGTHIKPADITVKAISKELPPDVEKQVGKSFEEFTSQKENGIYYWIKVHVGSEDSLHLKADQKYDYFGQGTKITIVD